MPLTHAARQKRLRARQRHGRAVVPIEIDFGMVVHALLESRRLSEAEALDRAEVTREIGDVVTEWAARWLRNIP